MQRAEGFFERIPRREAFELDERNSPPPSPYSYHLQYCPKDSSPSSLDLHSDGVEPSLVGAPQKVEVARQVVRVDRPQRIQATPIVQHEGGVGEKWRQPLRGRKLAQRYRDTWQGQKVWPLYGRPPMTLDDL